MKIGVIGGGALGHAVARGFLEHVEEVRVFDNIKERATHTVEEAATCDIVMICLPTPAKANGVCDTTAIDDFLDDAHRNGWWRGDRCYVVRSTTPIGFTRATSERHGLALMHSPEFLTARCAITDFQVPARNIIGWPKIDKMTFDNTLYDLYTKRFPGTPCLVMSSDESELVKLACNAFFATKVTFFNTIHQTAQQHDCRWDKVREGILSDGRIAHAHTMVPGPSGELGYGGACLSKDTASLRHSMPAYLQGLLAGVIATNAVIRGEATVSFESVFDDKHGVKRTMRNVREAQANVAQAVANDEGTVIPKDVAADFEREKNKPIIYGDPVAIRRIDPKPDETLRLKAQVLRMAHLAIKALGQGVRPALACGLERVIEEAGFDVKGYGEDDRGYALAQEKIEAALQEANRAVAKTSVASECGPRPGQLRDENGLPLWYHPSTNNEVRACHDDGWMDVNGWLPLTAEKIGVHHK